MASGKRNTLITGTNSGIGFEVASQLIADASSRDILGSKSTDKGTAAVRQLEARGLPGTVELVVIDVGGEDSVAAAAQQVGSTYGSSKGTEAQQMIEVFRLNAVGVHLTGHYFAPLLQKSTGIPRIINLTSGAGSIANRLDPNGIGNGAKLLPYCTSKTPMHMYFASQAWELEPLGIRVVLYGPGHTVSNLGPHDKSEYGAKPTSQGAAPITAMVNGMRDADAGRYIELGVGVFPW